MFNVMKAQLYQTVRHNFLYYVIFVLLCIFIVPELVSMDPDMRDDMCGSLALMLYSGSIPLAGTLIALLLTTYICGTDQTDHTMNYEIMNGTRRSAVYLGRVCASLLIGLAAAGVVIALPVLIASLIGGWGPCVTAQDALLRCLSALAPFIRCVAFFAFMTFLIGNGRLAMVINILITFIGTMVYSIMDAMDFDLPFWEHYTGLSSGSALFDMSNKRLSYVGDKAYWIVGEVLERQHGMQIVLVSLGVSAVILAAGLLLFRRKDLK